MRSLDSAPSCSRRAALGLIRDCSSFESKGSDRNTALDAIKTIYAARLAVCELNDAGLLTPAPCHTLFHEGCSSQAAGGCVKSLEARPQSWTSFSNNRQNALTICQATRAESDHEHFLSMFRAAVDNNQASEAALREQIEFSRKQLARQEALVSDIDAFSRTMFDEMQGALQGLERTLAEFVQMQSQVGEAQGQYALDLARLVSINKDAMESNFEASCITWPLGMCQLTA